MARLWLLGKLLTNLGLRFLAFLFQAYCLKYTVGVDTGRLIWAGSCFQVAVSMVVFAFSDTIRSSLCL